MKFKFLWLAIGPTLLFAAPQYPKPQGWVVDAGGILDPASKAQLEQQLSAFEKATSIEIAVVTVPSLEGKVIETYANSLFSQWRIGKKGKNNGVLVLVAPKERKVRIEVGYGLEPRLTDGACGEIIRKNLSPHFKAGRYGPGLLEGVAAIQRISSGQMEPPRETVNLKWVPSELWLALGFFVLILFPATTFAIILSLILSSWITNKTIFAPVAAGFIFDVATFRKRKMWGWMGSLMDSGCSTSGFGGGFGGSGGFGGFGGGSSGGGGASGGW